MLTRRAFIQGTGALAAGAATVGITFPKDETKEGNMSAVGFPERLYLVNQVADLGYPMCLINEAPIELSPDGADRLSHVVSCGHGDEAVAVFGIEIEASGSTEDVEVGLMLDGECVFKSILKNVSAFVDSFLASKDIFLAETPTGSIVGLFMPNGTRVETFLTFPTILPCPATIRTLLRTAVYRSTGVRPTDRRSAEPHE